MTPQEYDAWYDAPRGKWIYLPSAGGVAQWLEPRVPARLPFGSLILISGSKVLPGRRMGE